MSGSYRAFDQNNDGPPITGLVGSSAAMRQVYELTRRVARSNASVLLLGETGTGKEMIAKAIHVSSQRASGPFVRVNCGALSESLLESELFGHVRGSFTGAIANRTGRFEAAHTGTIFLDEINSTTPKLQVKLLRVLQEREFERVGDTQTIRVDTRVIAASNRDLIQEVEIERFREDLYYRLSVVTFRVPPLRERREDMGLLAVHALKRAQKLGTRATTLSEEALTQLARYNWPGNVRELENTLENAALYARGAVITPDDLPEKIRKPTDQPAEAGRLDSMFEDLPTLDELERRYLIHVLQRVGGSRTRAAEVLKIDRRTLYRMAERYQINLKETGE